MKFRTEIEIAPFEQKIGYKSRITAIGSCFAENISAKLKQAKFHVVSNPTGIVFNPLSAAEAIARLSAGESVSGSELQYSDGTWFDYRFHGSFSSRSQKETAEIINTAICEGHKTIKGSDWIIITFGTAWIYELQQTGQVVANCHKQPSSLFSRRRLSVDEIVGCYDRLIESELAGKNIILTVSPVRHLGDGLEGNGLSKATLRVAASELAGKHATVYYFPSFEIVNDDLRDYRFYAEDMVHPSAQAVDYIWDKFAKTAISDQANQLMQKIGRITSAVAHRPFDSHSEAYMEFCRKQLKEIDTIQDADLCNERTFFMEKLQIK